MFADRGRRCLRKSIGIKPGEKQQLDNRKKAESRAENEGWSVQGIRESRAIMYPWSSRAERQPASNRSIDRSRPHAPGGEF
jgi:hypothetical protein